MGRLGTMILFPRYCQAQTAGLIPSPIPIMILNVSMPTCMMKKKIIGETEFASVRQPK